MVKLNNDSIINQLVKNKTIINKRKEELNTKALRKVTHLYFQNKFIHEIEAISVCCNVNVLYLQGNSITKIENLGSFTKLTHLYLQDNKILKLENLGQLIHLEKLFLGHNRIAVVEGLENLKLLKELHIENQNLPLGEALQFDALTTEALSVSLFILDVSKNGMTSLWDICPLKSLQELHARDNALQSFSGVCEPLSVLNHIHYLDLTGNAVCSFPKYRDAIVISASPLLEVLDNKRVHEVTRQFVQNFDAFKKQHSMTAIRQSGLAGLLRCNKNERKISDLALYNNIPTKPPLAAITSLFPPWSSKRMNALINLRTIPPLCD